jgi:hypothetical protein
MATTTKTTTSKLGVVFAWEHSTALPHVTELKKKGLEVHVFTFPWRAATFPSLEGVHVVTSPPAQGMDCTANVLRCAEGAIEFAKTEKKEIHTIVNALTYPNTWDFDTTLENWKKLFWFSWDNKEYVNDVVRRTWESIKPKPAPIVVEESTEE